MVTSFTISKGYDSGGQNKGKTIFEMAKNVTMESFKKKLKDYQLPDDMIDEFVDVYKKIPTDDLSCNVDKSGNLRQCASGGEPYREPKEIARKAFAMLVLDECFKAGMCVNLTIS